jgi:hypothetical protein
MAHDYNYEYPPDEYIRESAVRAADQKRGEEKRKTAESREKVDEEKRAREREREAKKYRRRVRGRSWVMDYDSIARYATCPTRGHPSSGDTTVSIKTNQGETRNASFAITVHDTDSEMQGKGTGDWRLP